MMELGKKLAALDRIYKLYDEIASNLTLACAKSCAHCCTVNVTLTGLEGYRLVENMTAGEHEGFLDHLRSATRRSRFQPKLTTNTLAQLCLNGSPIPDEENDPDWGKCPLLTDALCPVYALRPFMCRCMVSKVNCKETGFADMEEWIVTVNQVFLQFIEHLDNGGFTGNLTDVLLFMGLKENRLRYKEDPASVVSSPFIANRPIPALVIPPEHREKLTPILETLRNIIL